MAKDYFEQYAKDFNTVKAGIPRTENKRKRNDFSSENLLQIAQQSGFGEEAKGIVESKGEKTNEIFSGGFISDIFDALNVFQYGIVGMIKGKGFVEGMKTRQSFSDKDALGEFGLPGAISGIVLDIAFDPMTYISPYTALKKIPGLQKLASKGGSAIAKTKAGDYLARKMLYLGGQSQVFKDAWNKMTHGVGAGYEKGKRIFQSIAKADTKGINIMKAMTSGDLDAIAKVGGAVKEGHGEIMKLQQRLFDAGAISEEMLKETSGKYLPRYFEIFENTDLKRLLRSGKPADEMIFSLVKAGKSPDEAKKMIEAAMSFDQGKAFKQLANDGRMGLNRLKTKHDKFGFTYMEGSKAKTLKFGTELERDSALQALGDRRIIDKFAPISDDYLQAMGEINDAGYATGKAIGQLNEMAEKSEMFNRLNKSPLVSDVMAEGMIKLPQSNNLGTLSGKFIHRAAGDYLTAMITPQKLGNWSKIIAGFKFGKVILNPATHVRNIMSNFMLNSMEGMSLVNPRTWKNYGRAARDLATDGQWSRVLKENYGVALDGMASQEITSILSGPEGMEIAGGLKKAWRNTFGKVGKGMAAAYENEETFSKVAAFMQHAEDFGAPAIKQLDEAADLGKLLKAGLPEGLTKGEAAARVAERATFNYAQVSPFVRNLRQNVFGMPFITFTAKATPQIARTALKTPRRISWIGKAKKAIENMSDLKTTARERRSEPQWVKDGFYIKLPMKDKHGRSAYFDLTYVIPFGDLASGQFFERQVDRETGLPESYAEGLLKKAPVINLITEIGKNQDFYGNKIWRDTDGSSKQMADLFRHVTKSYLPPLIADQIPGGYRAKGKKVGTRRPTTMDRIAEAGPDTQARTGGQEILRNMGIKITPVDADIQEGFHEWEVKKALESFLEEKGVLRQYQRAYIPKQK